MTERTFQSLAQAVEAHYEELLRFVRRRLGSSVIAAEIAQETWIRAAAVQGAPPDNPRAYLYRMAGNLALDRVRSEQVRTRASVDVAWADEVACPAPGPEQVLAAREELAILTEAVRELPDKCRAVFLLYRGHGLTMRQIAARLEISEKTVEKHIARAMLHLRARLRAAGREI